MCDLFADLAHIGEIQMVGIYNCLIVNVCGNRPAVKKYNEKFGRSYWLHCDAADWWIDFDEQIEQYVLWNGGHFFIKTFHNIEQITEIVC